MISPLRPPITPPTTTRTAPSSPNRTAVFRVFRTPFTSVQRSRGGPTFPARALLTDWVHVRNRSPSARQRQLRRNVPGRPAEAAEAATDDHRVHGLAHRHVRGAGPADRRRAHHP